MNLEVKGSMMMMMNAISPPRLGSTSLCSWLSPGKGMQISHGRNPIGAIVVKKKTNPLPRPWCSLKPDVAAGGRAETEAVRQRL